MIINGHDLGPMIPVYTYWETGRIPTPRTVPGYRATKHFCIAHNVDGTWSPVNIHGMAGLHFHLPKQAFALACEYEQIGIDWNTTRRVFSDKVPECEQEHVRDLVRLYAPLSAYSWERMAVPADGGEE